MYKQTAVQPRRHFIDNYGSDVQALTFTFADKVFTINRRGNRNILGFLGADGTYTLTNGTDKFLRMPRGTVRLESWTRVNGDTSTDFTHM